MNNTQQIESCKWQRYRTIRSAIKACKKEEIKTGFFTRYFFCNACNGYHISKPSFCFFERDFGFINGKFVVGEWGKNKKGLVWEYIKIPG